MLQRLEKKQEKALLKKDLPKEKPKIIEPKVVDRSKLPNSGDHNTEFTKAELKKIAKKEDKRIIKEALKVERKAI